MKKYKINVNGTEYEVCVEEMKESEIPQEKAEPAKKAETNGAGTTVAAPMPGTILDVKVSNGKSVKKGEVVAVLEAMKMENEIMAPCDGVVSSVSVNKGASVQKGDVLCVIA